MISASVHTKGLGLDGVGVDEPPWATNVKGGGDLMRSGGALILPSGRGDMAWRDDGGDVGFSGGGEGGMIALSVPLPS